MKKIFFSLALLSSLGLAASFQIMENKMIKIEFALGKNIVETAKISGIPEYGVSNVDDYIEYSARPLPTTVPVIYTSPGYEITLVPAFSLVLSADRRRTPNDIVSGARIRMANKHITTHGEGQLFVESLVEKFNKSKWKRHIPALCPAVTGRSSFLDATGNINSMGCPLDPKYKVKPDEWIKILKDGQNYEWIGDGVFASISVGYDDDTRGTTYNVVVEFEDYATKIQVDSENEARKQKEGDAKGWNTTAKAQRNLMIQAEIIEELEENAIKRGDSIISR